MYKANRSLKLLMTVEEKFVTGTLDDIEELLKNNTTNPPGFNPLIEVMTVQHKKQIQR